MLRHFEKVQELLIVDDDKDDQQMLKEIVEGYSSQINLRCLDNGKLLMDHLSKGKLPELIILDLNMPLKCGIQCLKEIMADHFLRHIPVVILSTSRNKDDIQKCYENGALLYFSKPWKSESLKGLVHSLIETDWKTFKRPMDIEEFTQIADGTERTVF
jgi:CheY-like chemotaxis protein